MNGIPVLHVEADCIARAWEESLVLLYQRGCDIKTQYDKPEDPPSKDATMLITITEPLKEPMIHKDFPGGPEDLQEYVMEVCEGIKDHLVRDTRDAGDTRWEYTYHQRLFAYQIPTLPPFNQIETLCQKLAKTPYTRRAQAVTWKVWEDNDCYDPACMQSIWCRVVEESRSQGVEKSKSEAVDSSPLDSRLLHSSTPPQEPQSLKERDSALRLCMNVRFRSNDAYKAAFMNIFALVQLQQKIAHRVSELLGRALKLGRYSHLADSYHLYGSYFQEFESRFLTALEKRTFEQRTLRYQDLREIMESARPAILEKARQMGR
jgi:thymidylate synthase